MNCLDVLVGQRPNVERRRGLRRDDVDLVAAGEDVGGDRRPQHRVGARFVVGEMLLRLCRLRRQHGAVAGRVGRAADRRQPLEVGARRVVQAHRRLPVGNARDGLGQVRHRVGAQRRRAVPRRPSRRERDAVRDLLRGLHGREAHLATRAGHAAAFREAVLGVDLRPVVLHHELDAELRAGFLAGLGQEDHVAIERHVQPLQLQHHHQGGDDVVLVVDGAASVDVAAVARGRERRMRPLRGVDLDHVGVAHDEERPLLAVASQPRHEIGPRRIVGEALRLDALLLQDRLEVIDGRALVARRVARVEPQDGLEVSHRLRLEARPVG